MGHTRQQYEDHIRARLGDLGVVQHISETSIPSALEAALDDILARAQKSVRIFDSALGRDYNSTRRYDALRRFLLSNPRNRLQIVVHDTQSMDRNCPRLLNLLRLHAHAIRAHLSSHIL